MPPEAAHVIAIGEADGPGWLGAVCGEVPVNRMRRPGVTAVRNVDPRDPFRSMTDRATSMGPARQVESSRVVYDGPE